MATTVTAHEDAYTSILLKLFDKSVLKQAKFAMLSQMLGDPRGKTLLDIGADNGVISYLFREAGGSWFSADLEAATVASIQALVGKDVYQIDGGSTPFRDDQFDAVVIIDFLEHIEDDRHFVEELYRILKPSGRLIVNVPHAKAFSVIRAIRLAVGLSDEKHGHVRPGYTRESLAGVLTPAFKIDDSRTYSRFFTELIDIFISLGVEMAGGGGQSRKGVVVTGEDLSKHEKKFKAYCAIYPLVKTMSYLDRLLFFTQGHSLIVAATSCKRLSGGG